MTTVDPDEIFDRPADPDDPPEDAPAGGSVEERTKHVPHTPPSVMTLGGLTEAELADALASEVHTDRYIYVTGIGWLEWNGAVWAEATEVTLLEATRVWMLQKLDEAVAAVKAGKEGASDVLKVIASRLSLARLRAILSLSRGLVEHPAEALDSDPDVLNTPSGVVDLRTGKLHPHDPDSLCTKITRGSYRPGYTHPDWDKALEAVSKEKVSFLQARFGQGVSGHPTPDGIVPILQGGGENGKSLLTTDGVMPALGDYASAASPKLFCSSRSEHSTERADLRGRRLVIAEELTEGRSLDVTALKQVADVGRIKARYTHKDNLEFDASHSIVVTTNYRPKVSETDHGTWRRLVLVIFAYTYLKPGQEIVNPEFERRGDPLLKARIKAGDDGQHDAIVTWIVEGAVAWYSECAEAQNAIAEEREVPASILTPPAEVAEDTLTWRAEADHVLGFWREILEPCADASIPTKDMLMLFNAWLSANGHASWSKETFGPRFAEHTETKRNRVVRRRIRDHSGIVRPVGPWELSLNPLPAQPEVWHGVRYRDDAYLVAPPA
jgi:P4 family phage/plasmid primase-like protien